MAGGLAASVADPRFRRCAALLRAGDPAASELLGELLSGSDAEAAGWEEVGAVLAEAGKPDAAAICFARALRAAPRAGLALRLGLLRRDLGQREGAESAFAEAARLDPRSARAWFLLGLSRQDRRDLEGAEKAYRAALGVEPGLAEAAVNLGIVLQEGGDLGAAKAAYAQAVVIRGDTFGRIAQAVAMAPKGELWLDLGRFRRSLGG